MRRMGRAGLTVDGVGGVEIAADLGDVPNPYVGDSQLLTQYRRIRQCFARRSTRHEHEASRCVLIVPRGVCCHVFTTAGR
jgi:hypothetical protein